MPTIDKKEVCIVLDWMETNMKNINQASEHFGRNRKTISSWKMKYSLPELRSEFQVTRSVGSSTIQVEKIIPDSLKVKATATQENMADIIMKSTTIIGKYVTQLYNQAMEVGVHKVKPYEIDKLTRFVKDYSPYIIEEGKKITEEFMSNQEKLQNMQIAHANKILKQHNG